MAWKIRDVQPGWRCSSMAKASRCSAVARLTTLVRAVPAFISVPWNQLRECSRCTADCMWPSFCRSSAYTRTIDCTPIRPLSPCMV